MAVCTGRGDRDGSHCCYVDGDLCQFLTFNWRGLPRCSLYSEWGKLNDNPEWVAAPIGQNYAKWYPGYDCGHWPQDIPDVIGGVCCWEGKL